MICNIVLYCDLTLNSFNFHPVSDVMYMLVMLYGDYVNFIRYLSPVTLLFEK